LTPEYFVSSSYHKDTYYALACIPNISFLLRPNSFFSTQFSNTLSLRSSLHVRMQAAQPHQTTGKIII
jgi:hypothetical protein